LCVLKAFEAVKIQANLQITMRLRRTFYTLPALKGKSKSIFTLFAPSLLIISGARVAPVGAEPTAESSRCATWFPEILGELIFRTSRVYATRGRNFLLTFLRLALQREELRVVRDQIGAPTWSRLIAAGTVHILAQTCTPEGVSARLRELSGIHHLTAAGEASWYDFARAIGEECSDSSRCGRWFGEAVGGQLLTIPRVIPISSADYPPARRPAYSVLSNAKLFRTFGIELPHWRRQLHLAFREVDVRDLQDIPTFGSP